LFLLGFSLHSDEYGAIAPEAILLDFRLT